MDIRKRHNEGSALQKSYEEESAYIGIRSDPLERFCEMDLSKKENYAPFGDLSLGLTTMERNEVETGARELYGYHQHELISRAFDKVNYIGSPMRASSIFQNRSETEIEHLKDHFFISRIFAITTRKLLNRYLLGVELTCDIIDRLYTTYKIDTEIAITTHPFSFQLLKTNFEVL